MLYQVCPLAVLPPGTVKLVPAGSITVGVFNCGGDLYALEDRCTHDDGPLCEGDFDCDERVVVCPRHGARFDLTTGEALTLPAYIPAESFPVSVDEQGIVNVEVGELTIYPGSSVPRR